MSERLKIEEKYNTRQLSVAVVSLIAVVGIAMLLGVATPGVLAQEQPDQTNGSSIQLDGEFGYASGASDSLNLGGKSMTIQAWVKHDGESQENAVIVRKGNGYRLELSGSGEERPVKFQISGSGFDSMTSNSGIPADRWTHISATYDGNQMQIYIDGELDASTSEDSSIGSSQSLPFVIGSGPSASEKFFSGQIDDVRIWDKSLSKFELQTNPYQELDGTETGLLSYYTFDGDGADEAVDQAGQNDLTLEATSEKVSPDAFPIAPDTYVQPNNVVTNEGKTATARLSWDQRTGVQDENAADSFRVYRSTSPDGGNRQFVGDTSDIATSFTDESVESGETYYYEVTSVINGLESDYSKPAVVRPYNESGGSSLALDGEDEYATLSNRPSKDLNLDTNEMTVEAWVKHDGESDDGATIIRNGNGWRLEIDGSGEERPVYFQISGSGFDSLRSNGGIHANEWTHVAATYDGNEMKIFINGELDSSTSEDSSIGAPNRPVRLGTADGADSGFFSGRIDEVRIWSTAREETQIRENYTRELRGDEPGLNGYWRFDSPGASVARGSGRLKGTFELKDGATIEEDGTFPVPARVYARGDDGSAKITWSERVSGDADKLNLYRSTDETGSDRQKVTELNPDASSYTDNGVTNGETYYYEVTSEGVAGQESDFSVPATAYVSSNTPGKAFDFDVDQDSFGTLTPRPSLALQDKTMAIEAWIKFNESADEQPTIIRRDGGWRMVLTGSGTDRPVRFQISGSGFDSITSNQGITAGEWTHIAGTYDGSELALYINGELDSTSGEDSSIGNPGQDITIGTINSKNSNFYAGQIDELRVWDTWRSPEQINSSYDKELIGDENGLVGYWRGCNAAGNQEARGSAVRPMTVNMTNMGCQTSGAPMDGGDSTGGTFDFGVELQQEATVAQGGNVPITAFVNNRANQAVNGVKTELLVDQNQDGQFESGEVVASTTVDYQPGNTDVDLTYTNVQLQPGSYDYQARVSKNGQTTESFTNGTLNVTSSDSSGDLYFGIELPTQSANVSQGGSVDITSSPRNNAEQPVSDATLELVVDQNQDGQFASGEVVDSKTVAFNAGEKRQEVLTYSNVQLPAGTYSYQAQIRKDGKKVTSFTTGTLNVTSDGGDGGSSGLTITSPGTVQPDGQFDVTLDTGQFGTTALEVTSTEFSASLSVKSDDGDTVNTPSANRVEFIDADASQSTYVVTVDVTGGSQGDTGTITASAPNQGLTNTEQFSVGNVFQSPTDGVSDELWTEVTGDGTLTLGDLGNAIQQYQGNGQINGVDISLGDLGALIQEYQS